MALETSQKAREIINALDHSIIYKPNPVARPIISGWEGPTERISSFIDHLLQPLLKYKNRTNPYPKPKDTTDFLNFIEKTKVAKDTILVSMDVTSLYYIPQEEGIEIVCRTYETFYGNELPIPTHFLIFMAEVETDIINQSPNIQTSFLHGTQTKRQ